MAIVDRQAAHTDGVDGIDVSIAAAVGEDLIARRDGGARCIDGRYPGGKGVSGLWQWIVAQMPPHSIYAEPFAGRAAIARRKPPALRTWLIEHDELAVDWLRSLCYPNAIVIQGDGIHWLQHAGDTGLIDEDSLVYCDPPYMLSTRVKRRIYSRELSDHEHGELLEVLTTLDCRVMLSGYWSQQYADTLRGWWSACRPTITRGGTLRDEWLWCNYVPDQVATSSVAVEYSDLGDDYRERERVARKVRRWQKNYLRMPAREQSAILRGLVAVSGSRTDAGDDARATTVPAMTAAVSSREVS